MKKAVDQKKIVRGTIDSVSMLHLCRTPAPRVKISKNRQPILGLKIISDALIAKRLEIFIDNTRGLSDEWMRTCSQEIIFPILTKWIDVGGVIFCKPSSMPIQLNRDLRKAGFMDAGDKLLVRIGLSAANFHSADPFVIATTDGDFWDPFDQSKTGRSNAPVAAALSAHNLESTILEHFFGMIAQ